MAEKIAMEQTKLRLPSWARQLNDTQIQGAELMAKGIHTQKEIAKMVGVEEQTISRRWKHNPIFMKYVDYLTTQNTLDSALSIKGLTLEAIDVYSELLHSLDPNVRFRVAKDILDRAGVKDLKFDLLPKETSDKGKANVDEIKKKVRQIMGDETIDQEMMNLDELMEYSKTVGTVSAEGIEEDIDEFEEFDETEEFEE